MAQEQPSRLAEWIAIVRGRAPEVKQYVMRWLAACREEPQLIWKATAVRVGVYLVVGLAVLWGANQFVSAVNVLPPEAKPVASTADFHVICTNPSCGKHFVVNRKLGFKRFPVKCPVCQQESGVQARQCFSETCQGAWVAPAGEGPPYRCSRCGETLP